MGIIDYVGESLRLRGYSYFLVYNPITGLRPFPSSNQETITFFRENCGISFEAGDYGARFSSSAAVALQKAVESREARVAVFIEFASRILLRVESPLEEEHRFFARMQQLSHTLVQYAAARQELLFNSIFWLCEKENDLPAWLSLGNPRIRTVSIPKPDHLIRRVLVSSLVPSLPGWGESPPFEQHRLIDSFVEGTEDMTAIDLISIAQLSQREGLPGKEIVESIRRYKIGVTEDPWKRIDRAKLIDGTLRLEGRVKGQTRATITCMDIVQRAVTGLSGVQLPRRTERPRGVLFFAGPTGVGKTELAKSLTELLFGDERAYVRFDMSEFSAEHADQRLLGAPPGYVGYDAGGELTNAIKQRPFSVILFDEIEKAHPRVLDKLLQLLDDGILTSGRGEKVYFSESIIIFTSNLGIFRIGSDGRRIANVDANDSYEEVERKIKDEINRFFKEEINRPELLSRLGENVVVFDFIRPGVATHIFENMLATVTRRLLETHKMTLSFSNDARDELLHTCTSDLSQGGRGISNKLEAYLVNPLARALFATAPMSEGALRIDRVFVENGVPRVVLQRV